LADAAHRDGLRQWRDLLATASGLAEGGRLAPCAPGTTGPTRQERQGGLVEGKPGLGERTGQKGGEAVGPNPTDRGKPGSKYHILTDRNGVPLAVVLTAANVQDSKVFEELIDAVAPVKRPGRGRPRRRPEKLHADKAYDFARCREGLRRRGIKSRIARRGKDSSERLGCHRWVVKRTLAWLARYRRLSVRYERRADIHEAFLYRGSALVCLCCARARSQGTVQPATEPVHTRVALL
jgi:transposase